MAEQTIKDVKKDIYLILHKAQEMLELTEEGFIKSKAQALDLADALAVEIRVKEDALTAMLAKMAGSNAEARKIVSVPAYIEMTANNIARLSRESRTRIKDGLLFSDKAISETSKLFAKAKDLLKKAADASVTGAQAALGAVAAECDSLSRMANDFATAHEDRLITGECSPKSTSIYLGMLYAFDSMGSAIKDTVKKLAAV
jgi:Na+/phosphate symporter